MGDLEGRVVIVTGGAKGIGFGCCECAAEAGACVVIADIDRERAEASAEKLGPAAMAVEHDVRSDWHEWVSDSGQRYLRGGVGSLMFVPAGCPHAFANSSNQPARMLFQAAPSGHEDYLDELAALLQAADGRPDPAAVAGLRRRYDIEQLTALRSGSN